MYTPPYSPNNNPQRVKCPIENLFSVVKYIL